MAASNSMVVCLVKTVNDVIGRFELVVDKALLGGYRILNDKQICNAKIRIARDSLVFAKAKTKC